MPRKMRTRQDGATLLEQAIAVLIQNQAAFLSQLSRSEREISRNERELSRIERENSQRFSRIERELEPIKEILRRHEAILNNLPEALLSGLPGAMRKIGLKPSK